MSESMTELARRSVLPLVLLGFLSAAWLSRPALDTSIVDVTLPKVILLVTGIATVLARPWQLAGPFDRRAFVALAVLAGWLIFAELLRGDLLELKRVVGALVFGGLALAGAWAGVRVRSHAAGRTLAIAVYVFAIVSFTGAALELITYGFEIDPLLWLWQLARPPVSLLDGPAGVSVILPVHYDEAGDQLLRVAGFSWHPNILAVSMMLPAALAAAWLVDAIRRGSLRIATLAVVLLAMSGAAIVWTHSRTGLIGLVLVVGATSLLAWVADRGRALPSLGRLRPRPWLGLLAVSIPLLGLLVVADPASLLRIAGAIAADPADRVPGVPSVIGDAANIAAVHWRMISTGLKLLTDTWGTVIAGPGLDTYTIATHDRAGGLFIREALGTPDPNSFWLTFALVGGVVAAVIVLGLLVVIWLRMWRTWRTRTQAPPSGGWLQVHRMWLLAWIPAWAIVQNVGGQPFEVAEIIPFAFILGLAIAFASDPETT